MKGGAVGYDAAEWIAVEGERGIQKHRTREGVYRVRVKPTKAQRAKGVGEVVRVLDGYTLGAACAERDALRRNLGMAGYGVRLTIADAITAYRAHHIDEVAKNDKVSSSLNRLEKLYGSQDISNPPSVDAIQRDVFDAVGPDTARNFLTTTRKVYGDAVARGYIQSMPAALTYTYKTTANAPAVFERQGAEDAFTATEAVSLCRDMLDAGHPIAPLAITLFGGGLRVEEALALNADDIDFDEAEEIGLVARIPIHKRSNAKTRAANRRRVENGEAVFDMTVEEELKTGASARWVVIPQPYSGMLQLAIAGLADKTPICRGRGGERMSTGYLRKTWASLFERPDRGRAAIDKRKAHAEWTREKRAEGKRISEAMEKGEAHLLDAYRKGDAKRVRELERKLADLREAKRQHGQARNPYKLREEGGLLYRYGFHELRLARHTVATALEAAEIDPAWIGAYLGHGKQTTAQKHYINPKRKNRLDHVAADLYAYYVSEGVVEV